MNAYVIAAIAGVGGILLTLGTYWLFYHAGTSQGAATAQLGTAQTDLNNIKKADAIVTQSVTDDDLQKSLKDGTF